MHYAAPRKDQAGVGSGESPCPVGRRPLFPRQDILSCRGRAPSLARLTRPPAARARLTLTPIASLRLRKSQRTSGGVAPTYAGRPYAHTGPTPSPVGTTPQN